MEMDVMVCAEPGRLELERRPRPRCAPGEVLLRPRRVGMCGTDMHIFGGTQPYLSYPRVMGHEIAAEVVEGNDELRPGDTVFVMPYISCGTCVACAKGRTNCCTHMSVLGVHQDGALAEYIAVPADFVFKVEGIDLDAVAMIEFLAIGAHAVRRAAIEPGQQVLVVGAGPIGIACALFAQAAGGIVTALDGRQDRLDFARDEIGIAHIVSLDAEADFRLAEITNGDFYDVVFDATGNPKAMEAGFTRLAHAGTYVLVSVVQADICFNDPEFHKRETTLLASRNATAQDFRYVVEAIRSGIVPVQALATHRTSMRDLPAAIEQWSRPEAHVIKGLVEL